MTQYTPSINSQDMIMIYENVEPIPYYSYILWLYFSGDRH